MNLPTDKIFDIELGYGWLVLPLFKGYWLYWSDIWLLSVTSNKNFHNCTKTGVH
jgi:hypothetical protein